MPCSDSAFTNRARAFRAFLASQVGNLTSACDASLNSTLIAMLEAMTVRGLTTTANATMHQYCTQPTLTVTGITAANKAANGNTTATLTVSGAALVGVATNHTVSLNTGSAAGAFASASAGTWTVTISGLTISGADAWRYSLTQPTTTATIT